MPQARVSVHEEEQSNQGLKETLLNISLLPHRGTRREQRIEAPNPLSIGGLSTNNSRTSRISSRILNPCPVHPNATDRAGETESSRYADLTETVCSRLAPLHARPIHMPAEYNYSVLGQKDRLWNSPT